MDPNLKDIYLNIKDLGLTMLGRAIYNATFSEQGSPYSNRLCVLDAAQGTELVIKARIAQEHPLLIFKELLSPKENDKLLDFKQLYSQGKTYSYSDLPQILWATTGYKIKKLTAYRDFGKLRNGLMHFAAPRFNLANETLSFIFEFTDYMTQDFWKETPAKFAEEFNPEIVTEGYLGDRIYDLKLHPNTKKYLRSKDNDFDI